MNEQEFKSSIIAMIRNSNIEGMIDKVIESGAINITEQDPENFLTRKAVVYSVLSSAADSWWNDSSEEFKSECENIKHFI